MYLYTIRISIEQYLLFVVNMRLTTYLHHTWGFRRCSFRLVGQCEGLSIVERATELAPRFFLMYYQQIYKSPYWSLVDIERC